MTRSRQLVDLLGVDEPIVLGPFGGMSSVALTATVSRLGGLGSYGLYGYDAARIADTTAAIRAETDRPFALNVWLPTGDEVRPDVVDLASYLDALAPYFAEVGLPRPTPPSSFLPDVDEQLAAVIEARPAAVSVVFGVPSSETMDRVHGAGIVVIGTATTVAEAVALADGGVDVVVASGAEAGGHRVSFLRSAEESLVGTFALIPQVVDAVDVPVVAAGGIADRRGVAAALALGAAGVQVGTAFLATRQSAVNDAYRRQIADATDDATVLTRAMSGRLARGLPNRAVREIEANGQIAPFPAQNWMTGRFRAEAARLGTADVLSLWMGQAAPLARRADAAEVMAELVAGLPTG